MTISPLADSPLNLPNGGFSDPGSLIEQINASVQNASQPFIPISIPGVGSTNTQPRIIPGLPAAISSLERKYTENLPALSDAVRSGAIPEHALNSVAAYDIRNAKRGQSPLDAVATARSLQTIATREAATPEPDRSAWNVLGNAGRDLKTIALSIPHIPSQLYKEARDLPKIGEAISEADNPITGLLHAPGFRLLPGAYTLGNLAEGREGIQEALTHPLMTGLDVFGADVAAGRLAGMQKGLLRTTLPKTAVGKTVGGWKRELTAGIRATRGGVWLDTAFGEKARTLSQLINGMANQVHVGLDGSLGKASIIDPDGMLSTLSRRATDLAKKWSPQITPKRMRELTDHMQLDPAHIPDITDVERGFLNEVRDVTDRITAYHIGNGDLERLVTRGQMEVYNLTDAAKIKKQWRRRDNYEAFTQVRQLIKNPEVITPDDLLAVRPKVIEYLRDERFPASNKLAIGRGYAYATRGIQGTLPQGYYKALGNRDFAAAIDLLESHVSTFDAPITRREIGMRRDWLTQTRKFTPARSKKAAAEATRVETETLPARWRETRDKLVSEKVQSQIAAMGSSSTVNVAELMQQAINRDYRRIAAAGLLSADDIGAFTREAAETIAQMKNQGIDPIFVHHVNDSAVTAANYPQPGKGTIHGQVAVPTQLKTPSLVATPYVHDVTVALSHQGVEILNRAAQKVIYEELLRITPKEGQLIAPFAKTRAELDQIYEGVARNRQSINPTVDARAIVEARIQKEWVKFPIDRLSPELKQSLGLLDEMGENHPYIPRSVHRNLELFSKPPDLGIMDDILHAFRTSLLALSPRFLLYQIIGDAVQVMGRTNPITVWTKLKRAREMARDHKLPETLRPIQGHVMDPTLEWKFRAGSTLGRLLPQDSALRNFLDTQPIQRVAKKTYSTVAFFSDTYLAMSYLYGYDKALVKGMTKEAAEQAGEALARKSLMTWDTMTAFERTTMRTVFPFYGFAQHMLRYAAKYPADHPFRAAITASIARNELEDLGTGLPQNMMNMLFLGDVDSEGHQRVINTAGMNPFRDVSNFTTLAGWLNSTNPVISGVLNAAGLDTVTGGPDLYPNLQYDPETGRLHPEEKNPLLSIAYQTIPQSQILGGMLAKSSEFKDLMRLDRAAAMRMIASQGGIPLSYRDLAVDRSMIQGEVARESAQGIALSDALKSGDWADARKWPELRVTLDTIQQLYDQGALAQFQPGGSNSTDKLQQIQDMIASSVG